jgi:hypothetical protein
MLIEQTNSSHLNAVHGEPWLAPYLIDPFFASCEQGVFVSTCEVFARCGAVALFITSVPNQYGVGLISPADALRVMECYQYPSRSIAVLMFLEQSANPSRPIQ